jgi:hypothetical protein
MVQGIFHVVYVFKEGIISSKGRPLFDCKFQSWMEYSEMLLPQAPRCTSACIEISSLKDHYVPTTNIGNFTWWFFLLTMSLEGRHCQDGNYRNN